MGTVEIVAIGDELLRGIVAESNSHWLAKRVAARGATLQRVQVLPDLPEVVASALRECLERAPTLLVTHGGLGPTDDDRTREALALALDRPQEPHAEAEAIVRRRYAELAADGAVDGSDVNEARLRMALLPRGARALDNQIGTAPGIVIEHGSTTVVALPGVPPELFWIWEGPLSTTLDAVLGPGGFHEHTMTLHLLDESAIAWLLKLVADRHPSVYVKSRASGFGAEDLVRVTLAAGGQNDDGARALVEAADADLRAALRAEGIDIA